MRVESALNGSVRDCARAVSEGSVSAESLGREIFTRIATYDGELNAYVYVDEEELLRQGRQIDERARNGEELPLAGVPVSVKDNIDVAGAPSASGARFLEGRVAASDAEVVRRLRAAGALIVGKTNLHEFAWGGTTENEHFGTTRNPWDLTRNASGSSGGSAVSVAAGMALGSLGTDTGGSVREPAAVTGLASIRPTLGRVPTGGVLPLAWTMDTVGPFARNAEDLSHLFRVMLDGARPRLPQVERRRIRLGVIADFTYTDADPEVLDALRAYLERLQAEGVEIVEVDLPGIDRFADACMIVHAVEPASVHRRMLAEHYGDYSRDVRVMLLGAMGIPAEDYLVAQRWRTLFRERTAKVFRDSGVDALVTPTSPTVADLIGQDPDQLVRNRVSSQRKHKFFTALASMLGYPALNLPMGLVQGLPVGVQLIGIEHADQELIELGAALETLSS